MMIYDHHAELREALLYLKDSERYVHMFDELIKALGEPSVSDNEFIRIKKQNDTLKEIIIKLV